MCLLYKGDTLIIAQVRDTPAEAMEVAIRQKGTTLVADKTLQYRAWGTIRKRELKKICG